MSRGAEARDGELSICNLQLFSPFLWHPLHSSTYEPFSSFSILFHNILCPPPPLRQKTEYHHLNPSSNLQVEPYWFLRSKNHAVTDRWEEKDVLSHPVSTLVKSSKGSARTKPGCTALCHFPRSNLPERPLIGGKYRFNAQISPDLNTLQSSSNCLARCRSLHFRRPSLPVQCYHSPRLRSLVLICESELSPMRTPYSTGTGWRHYPRFIQT